VERAASQRTDLLLGGFLYSLLCAGWEVLWNVLLLSERTCC
jgi:hypothetical protein